MPSHAVLSWMTMCLGKASSTASHAHATSRMQPRWWTTKRPSHTSARGWSGYQYVTCGHAECTCTPVPASCACIVNTLVAQHVQLQPLRPWLTHSWLANSLQTGLQPSLTAPLFFRAFRVKELMTTARPHNQLDAVKAGGMGAPDNGPRLRSQGMATDMDM